MKINDDQMIDTTVYIVISNSGKILKCFGNEENAYSFATQECFKYIEENDTNKSILEEIYDVDADEDADFEKKISLIHGNYEKLIRTEHDYYNLVHVEEHTLDTNDIYE